MLKTISKAALLLSSGLGLIGGSQVALAQVAPTEVNEEAVDDFGMERKTGRFTWSTGEVIGIGGEGSRVGVSVTGIRTPPHRTFIWYGGTTLPVETNQPRLTVAPVPVDLPQFPGEVDPNQNYVTIDYFGGSHTFRCNATKCHSLYLLAREQLEAQGSGYLFTAANGTTVYIENGSSTTTFTDGRQVVISSDGYRKNNFGFMLKLTSNGGSGATVTAVNQAVDYCSESFGVSCGTLTQTRTATLPATFVPILDIIDAAGGTTKLRWVEKTAMEKRPPVGYPIPGYPTIASLTSRYPAGITLPGSTSEDITINYATHSATSDTHDDIRVDQIIKNGVTVDYDVVVYWPYGKAIEVMNPIASGGNVIEGNMGMGRLEGEQWSDWYDDRDSGCSGADFSTNPYLGNVCTGGALLSDSGASAWADPPQPTFEEAPPDEDDPNFDPAAGSQVYELTITGRIGGTMVSESKSIRPYADEGMARRRLIYTKDGLSRETEYFYNRYDEVGGVTAHEGNGTLNGYDFRGNINVTSVRPKTTGQPNLDTTYTYAADCTTTNRAWCNSPISMTDPNGNTTNYEYNQYGQLTKEMGPAPSAGAARPTVINEYTLRTAYIKNSSGNPIAAGPAISLLTKSFTCITATNCSASTPAADKIVTEYDYGPTSGLNNLLLRGMTVTAVNDQGQIETLRTCYQYNYFGERIAETQPKAGLTSCQ